MNRWRWLERILTAAILLGIAAGLAGVGYVKSGLFDVAASRPHSKAMEWVTHQTMINSIKRRATDIPLPPHVSTAQAVRGFCQYEEHCVACHGAAAVAREQWAAGLNPQPPYLIDATHLWTPREIHRIVRDGIKMTGMPAWRESMSDGQIDDVVAFVEAMPQMPPQTYLRWRSARLCGDRPSSIGSILGTPHAHQIAPKAAIAAVR